jgi:hypothetical protein
MLMMMGADEILVRKIAADAMVDVRSVRKFLAGQPVRGFAGARIARAVAELDLTQKANAKPA